jgi:hypothetical protein
MWATGAVRAIVQRFNSSRLVVAGMALMMVLATAGFLVGRGESALRLQVKPGEAWLPTDKNGSINLVDGLAGKSSAALVLTGAGGDKLIVTQIGGRVLVLNATTGLLVRIDPVQLLLGASERVSMGSVVVAGLAATYLVNYAARTVQRIDPVTLKALGPAVLLRWQPAGTAIVDRAGTLWVPVPEIGSVVPVTGGIAGHPVKVGAVGANVVMTSANGVPIAVNRSARRLTVIGLHSGAAQDVVTLPASVGLGGPSPLLVPLSGGTSSLPMVDPNGSPSLVIVNLSAGTTTSAQLGSQYSGHNLGPPVQAGVRVFIPDYTTGRVLIYNVTQGQIEADVPVLSHAGLFTAEVIDGIAYFNDPNGNRAVVVTPDGQIHYVTKNGPHVPTVRKVAQPRPTPAPINTVTPGPSPHPTPIHGHPPRHHKPKPKPTKSKSPKPSPSPTRKPSPSPTPSTSSPPAPPLAPGQISATPGAGFVKVTWQAPSSGGQVRSYQVTASPAPVGGTQKSLGSTGRMITGLTCGTNYTFTVSSIGMDGKSVSAAPTAPVMPCLPPGPPQGVTASLTLNSNTIVVNWQPPASSGGGTVAYQISVNNGSPVPASAIPDTLSSLPYSSTYSFTVFAVTPAGQSMMSAPTVNVGPWSGYSTTNSGLILYVRSGPGTNNPSVAQLSASGGVPVTIDCQTYGGSYHEPNPPYTPRGNIWDRIQAPDSGYVGDYYIGTPNAQVPALSPPIWTC